MSDVIHINTASFEVAKCLGSSYGHQLLFIMVEITNCVREHAVSSTNRRKVDTEDV